MQREKISFFASLLLSIKGVAMYSTLSTITTVSGEMVEQLTDRANLSGYLSWIWRVYFDDIPQANSVNIEYGYPWKSRLGRIRLSLNGSSSLIEVNTLLQAHQVPEYVLVTTIAHELAHYAHGFGSPLPQK